MRSSVAICLIIVCMQINSAVELALSIVKNHQWFDWFEWLEPKLA
jgi:hypothetical protein